FTMAGARRARTRAGIVRGLVAQLARATAVSLSIEARGAESMFVLRYVITSVRLTRVVDLSAVELAALRIVAERANIHCLPAGTGDKELVAKTLAKLLDGAVPIDIARLAQEMGTP
ncbi:MAG TPA: hypothetical protein VM580_34745, partial [Labilithrix sp.]|nr:hypothetical protein [Labilithrix sp.]